MIPGFYNSAKHMQTKRPVVSCFCSHESECVRMYDKHATVYFLPKTGKAGSHVLHVMHISPLTPSCELREQRD